MPPIDNLRQSLNRLSQDLGILLLAVANLVIRYGSAKFPATEPGAK